MRCTWADGDPLMQAYHDAEWGVPLHDDRALFELLSLEGAQAGLSWLSVLRRRDGYRAAFANFDIDRVSTFGAADIERLLADTNIIRNRQKVISTIQNAQRIQAVQREHGSFDRFVWSFVPDSVPIVHHPRDWRDLPTTTDESKALSKALSKLGFGFVGPTICYAFMESAGLVNDHVVDCFRYTETA